MEKMFKAFIVALMVLGTNVMAHGLWSKTVNEPLESYYPKFKESLAKNQMHTVLEMDLLQRFEDNYAKKYGKEFNKNNYSKIISLVVCNGAIGVEVANNDKMFMALCPVRITIIEQNGKTTVSFIKAASVTKGTKVEKLMKILDQTIIDTVNLTENKYMERVGERTSFKGIFED